MAALIPGSPVTYRTHGLVCLDTSGRTLMYVSLLTLLLAPQARWALWLVVLLQFLNEDWFFPYLRYKLVSSACENTFKYSVAFQLSLQRLHMIKLAAIMSVFFFFLISGFFLVTILGNYPNWRTKSLFLDLMMYLFCFSSSLKSSRAETLMWGESLRWKVQQQYLFIENLLEWAWSFSSVWSKPV